MLFSLTKSVIIKGGSLLGASLTYSLNWKVGKEVKESEEEQSQDE
jgi:hypothetical protein